VAGVLQCTVTTPEKKVFEGPVRSVVVPAVDGQLGILPRHAPLIGLIGYGELRIDAAEGAGALHFFVEGGFVQVLGGRVSVLAANAVPAAELDASAEEEAVRAIASARPASGSGWEEREAHARSLGAARSRLRLAKGP